MRGGFVFDSSSLIYLGKVGLLENIGNIGEKCIIPLSVYQEVVVRGLERGETEASHIEDLVKRKVFVVRNALVILDKIPYLTKADTEVLSLSKETGFVAIIDEAYGNSIAESYGIESHGSIFLLLKLLEKKLISKKETVNYLDIMISLGFYLSIEKYRDVLKKVEIL